MNAERAEPPDMNIGDGPRPVVLEKEINRSAQFTARGSNKRLKIRLHLGRHSNLDALRFRNCGPRLGEAVGRWSPADVDPRG